MLRRRGRTWQSCHGERARTAVGYITLIFHTPIWQACPKLLTGFLLKDTLSRHMAAAHTGTHSVKFNHRKLIYAHGILKNVSFHLQPWFFFFEGGGFWPNILDVRLENNSRGCWRAPGNNRIWVPSSLHCSVKQVPLSCQMQWSSG